METCPEADAFVRSITVCLVYYIRFKWASLGEKYCNLITNFTPKK